MLLTTRVVRHAAAAAIGTGAVASAMMLSAAPSALADPPPNCTAGDLAQVAAGVAAGTSVYMFSHPDVNAFFTGLAGQPRDTVRAQIKDYAAANPQVQAELNGIRQPMVDLRNRCGITGGIGGDSDTDSDSGLS